MRRREGTERGRGEGTKGRGREGGRERGTRAQWVKDVFSYNILYVADSPHISKYPTYVHILGVHHS